MKGNQTDGEMRGWIGPETEARVVALVLGESTAFESSEVERLVAEWPGIRDFKNRIDSVHELVLGVVKPQCDADWRLAEDLRSRLLETMDLVAGARREPVLRLVRDEEVATRRVDKRPWWRRPMAVQGVAACAAMGLLLVIVYSPAIFERDDWELDGVLPVAREERRTKQVGSGSMTPVSDVLADDAVTWRSQADEQLDLLRTQIGGAIEDGWADGSSGAFVAMNDAVLVAVDNSDSEESQSGRESSEGADETEVFRYAAGLQLPANGVTPLYAEFSGAKRELQRLKERGLGSGHPAILHAQESVAALESDLETGVVALSDHLGTQLDLVESRLQEMGQVVSRARDESVDRALEAQDYIEAKREYEAEQGMLQSMKLQHSGKRIGLKIPKTPVTMHREATKAKKKGGTIFGGGSYESQAILRVHDDAPEIVPVGGRLGISLTGSAPTRSFMRSEFEVVASERTLGKVVDKLGLEKRWGVSKQEAVAKLNDAVTAEQIEGTHLIGIKVRDADPERAEAIAREVAEDYLQRRAEEEHSHAEAALDALNSELRDQEDLVEDKRKVLHTIVQAVGLPYFEDFRGGSPIGQSESEIFGISQRQKYETQREKQQLEMQIKSLQRLKGGERQRYAAGIQIPSLSGAEPERRWLGTVSGSASELAAAAEQFSTFSLHVSDVSFKLAKAALARGEWPNAGSIRIEEFVNAFDYGDLAPTPGEKVSCSIEQAAHPFRQQRNLVRVSMRTAATGRPQSTPLRLTVLLDHSGSMDRIDRVESVRRAFELLAKQLGSADRVTLISFARTPRLLADRFPGDKAGELTGLIASTPIEGGTNLEAVLQLGLEKAREQWLDGAQNRIVLLTDGAANLGNARAEDLAAYVDEMRRERIAFDACGVGAVGLNDGVLESLTRQGDGRYYFLDRPEDADAGFARQIAGALRPAAKNVKVQVRFNPNRVGRYRLFGFEKHRLAKEDFRNDGVDAAELTAEEAGNAVYQVEMLAEGTGMVGTVAVRFEDSATGRMVERRWTIPYQPHAPRFDEAEPSMQLAGCAALLAQRLKGEDEVKMVTLARIASGLSQAYPGCERVRELREMVATVRGLSREELE